MLLTANVGAYCLVFTSSLICLASENDSISKMKVFAHYDDFGKFAWNNHSLCSTAHPHAHNVDLGP